MIELHTYNTPNGRKISVALEEMGLPYSVHVIDITKGEQHQPAFLEISPNNRIPAIVDPDGPGGAPLSVFESGAILLYLGEKTGQFLPTDLRERLPVLEWLMWQMGGFGPMPGQVHHFLSVRTRPTSATGWSATRPRRAGCTACWTAAWRRWSSSPARFRWRISPSLAGPGGTSGTRSTWPISRRCAAGIDALMARPAVQRGFAVALA